MINRHIFVFATSCLLGACSNQDMADLQSYVDDVKSRPSGYIEPLPEMKPVERYLYQSTESRDPFSMEYNPDDAPASIVVDSVMQRELQREVGERNKEDLEHFELDGLSMVGTLLHANALWGIIQDPEGTVYRVQEGNYLGRNYGKIQLITEEKIELREIVRDTQGAWEERPASIALDDEEA